MKRNKLARNDISRIFVAENGTSPNDEYSYHNCMKMEGLDKSLPDVTVAQCPHPTQAKKFIEVAEIESGEESRWSTSLTGRMPLRESSVLFDLFNARQSFDMQVHFGECYDVSDFNSFDLAMILENVRINNYSTDPLGSLESSEVALINETVSVSIGNVSYAYKPIINEVGEEVTVNGAITDLAFTQGDTCTNDYANLLFGLKIPSDGVGNDVYIVWSDDKGVTWNEVLLDCAATLSGSILRSYNIQADEKNVYVTLNEASGNGHIYIVRIIDILNGIDGSPIISVLDNVNSIYNSRVFGKTIITVGNAGTINLINANSLTYTTLPSGTVQNLYAIDGISEDEFIIGGASNTLRYYNSSSGFRTITTSGGGTSAIEAVAMLNEDIWLVGNYDGYLLATTNAGKTWKVKELFGACVSSISFVNSIVGFLGLKTGEVYRTIDGGATWIQIEDELAQLPSGAELLGLYASDVNTFYAYGRVAGGAVPDPCDPLNTFIVGDVGWILKGGV
jgi:hypothetical protein